MSEPSRPKATPAPRADRADALDLSRLRERLQNFDFRLLFVEELGWSRPLGRPQEIEVDGARYRRTPIAELSGVAVMEVEALTEDGEIPAAAERAQILREISRHHHENLLLFVDRARTKSLWVWGKRDGGKVTPRNHPFVRGQTGDLFLSKLAALVVELAELDERGSLPVTHVARKLRRALDVEQVTKRFFVEYEERHQAFVAEITGLANDRDRRWYASVLLNRLMFITFLQKKGFLDRGDFDYLKRGLAASREREPNHFFRGFLRLLFFEGFAKPPEERSAHARQILGEIRYLNGGLFLPHRIEIENPDLDVPDSAFAALFDLFDRYSWHLDDTPGGADDEINPDVLGSIFEKYINQKAFGAYYTRPEITGYLCEEAIHRLILDRLQESEPRDAKASPDASSERWDSLADLLLRLDARRARLLLLEILPRLSILDPACGSGAFLVAAQKTLLEVYSAVLGFARLFKDAALRDWLQRAESEHPSLLYYLKKRIVTDNLYGVDVMEEAVEIARLRLFLALVASARTVEELEPLPNVEKTESFRAAFRINPREAIAIEGLDAFLHDREEHLEIRLDLVRRLSPESLSLLEVKSESDLRVAQKLLRFPMLGEKLPETWNFKLANEFHMSNDSALFNTTPGPNDLPLFTGKMFNQFELTAESSGYWVEEEKGASHLGHSEYQRYRWVHRRIARSTDTRTMICAIAPKNVFTEVNSTTISLTASGISDREQLLLCALTNSFVFDWLLRLRVNSTLNMFYLYQSPLPRLRGTDPKAAPLIDRAARLTCVDPIYADLWREAMGTDWTPSDGATDPTERAQLRAELDARVAHLYGLDEEELRHVLASFPVVEEEAKAGVLAAFRQLEGLPTYPRTT